MSQQAELLQKLLAFYQKRYEGKTLEDKFNDAAEDLVGTGDIERAVYVKFCIDNDVEPRIPKKKTSSSSSSSSSSSYGSSGCGGSTRTTYTSSGCGGGYTRSSC